MSIFSLPMRWRFFFSPLPPAIRAFSSRSRRFSSLVFFFGRVLWLMESRSILPSTFTFGASFCSLFSVNTSDSFFCESSSAGSSEMGSCGSVTSDSTTSGFGCSTGCSTCSGCTGSGFSTVFVSGFGLSAAAFGSGSAAGAGVSAFTGSGFLPRLLKSIFPSGLNCCFCSTTVSTLGSGRCFFSFCFLGYSFSARPFCSLSFLN